MAERSYAVYLQSGEVLNYDIETFTYSIEDGNLLLFDKGELVRACSRYSWTHFGPESDEEEREE